MSKQPKHIKLHYYSSYFFPENKDTSYMGFNHRIKTYQPYTFEDTYVENENFLRDALEEADFQGERFINFTVFYYDTVITKEFTKEELTSLLAMKELIS